MTPEELLYLADDIRLTHPETSTRKDAVLARAYIKLHADHAALSVKLEETERDLVEISRDFVNAKLEQAGYPLRVPNEDTSSPSTQDVQGAAPQAGDEHQEVSRDVDSIASQAPKEIAACAFDKSGICLRDYLSGRGEIDQLRVKLEAAEQERDRCIAIIEKASDEAWNEAATDTEASRGEVVKACPHCHSTIITAFAGQWTCGGCSNDFTEPTYWQRVNKP